MADIHKVFVSYHHANDQTYRDAFERMFSLISGVLSGVFISKSVQVGEISPYLTTDTIRAKIRDVIPDARVRMSCAAQCGWRGSPDPIFPLQCRFAWQIATMGCVPPPVPALPTARERQCR